jgi:hypothetical protein
VAQKKQSRAGKHAGGRPTEYKPQYSKIAFQMALIGATDAEMAAAFEVSEQTVNSWKQKYPKFLESIKEGKLKADSAVAASLYKRAMGFHVPAVKLFNSEAGVIEHQYQEYYPPDTTAAIFFLKNRRPAQFRQNPEIALTVSNDVQVDLGKPPEEWGQSEYEAYLKKHGAMPDRPQFKTNGA